MSKVTFDNKNSVFYSTLRRSVDQYFQQNQISKTGNLHLYAKTVILISAAVFIYIALLTLTMPVWGGILLSCGFGFILASIGFNVMHDACHGGYSDKKWVNELMGLTLNALGGNAFIWKLKHNVVHHTYTNVDGVDDDIHKSPLMRQCHSQKWVPAHRIQHFYVFLIYAISSFAWIFMMDFNKYFKKQVVTTPFPKMSFGEHFIFWITKALYAVFYIAIPVLVVGWQAWAVGFACMHACMGLTLALVFQLAHVVENTEFEAAGSEPKRIENEWAIHQIKTTANFARDNRFVSWWVGGLNYQIEHHLFPRVSHVHYPAISVIVKQTCREFNLPYNEYPTMTEAVASHYRFMRELSRKPVMANA